MVDKLNLMKLETEFDFEFTLAEIVEMENLYQEKGEKLLDQGFCQGLASKFSGTPYRRGKSVILWEHVYSWFLDTKKELETKVSSFRQKPKEIAAPIDMADKSAARRPSLVDHEGFTTRMHKMISKNAAESSRKPKAQRVAELSELIFEARSFKDFAWYDVASFINYRVTNAGELEVRVRFAGFGKDHDEWVNVNRAVRERSIPLEQSECPYVEVGDLVLCFREGEERAVYCDAHIVEIQRKLHDTDGCRCIFIVRYDHDGTEDQVQLNRICCRPTRLMLSQGVEDS